MRVEQRLGTRHDVSLDVVVDYRHTGNLTAQAHNISVDGIFLRPKTARIPVYAQVNILFELNGQQFQRRGFVVRSSTEGIGVLFDKRTPEVSRLLRASALS
ncbi:MAG: PilZ domain-containing protein [Gammaproteobacteria bacterium]|nr:PilZ domain-containing protein [Gammaproteobacteria bacterium]